jgi:hypothetical protein
LNRVRGDDPGSDTARYRLVSRWPLVVDQSTAWQRIGESLRSGDPMPWWRSLRAEGGLDGIRMTVHSGLGYRVRVQATGIAEGDRRLDFRVSGDIVGVGSVQSEGRGLLISMDVLTTRPWMNRSARLLGPVFALGHRLVMWRGRRRFNGWLSRTRPGLD